MNQTKVSVLLAVKNGEKYIEESINSVLNQDYDHFELLISDDNSNDETLNLINKFRNNNIKVYSQKQSLGQFGNFNFLLKEATGEIIHFWSHDDVMYSGCLSAIVNFHLKNPTIGMSYCSGNTINEYGVITKAWEYDATPEIIDNRLYSKYSLAYGCLAGSISQVSLNRKNIGLSYYFNQSYLLAGDFELWTRIAENFNIGFISQELTSIRIHELQVSNHAASNFASVVEGLPITNALIKQIDLPFTKKRELKRELILIHYFQRVMVLLFRKEFKLFFKGMHLLEKEDNLILLCFSWFRFRLRNKEAFYKHRKNIASILFD